MYHVTASYDDLRFSWEKTSLPSHKTSHICLDNLFYYQVSNSETIHILFTLQKLHLPQIMLHIIQRACEGKTNLGNENRSYLLIV